MPDPGQYRQGERVMDHLPRVRSGGWSFLVLPAFLWDFVFLCGFAETPLGAARRLPPRRSLLAAKQCFAGSPGKAARRSRDAGSYDSAVFAMFFLFLQENRVWTANIQNRRYCRWGDESHGGPAFELKATDDHRLFHRDLPVPCALCRRCAGGVTGRQPGATNSQLPRNRSRCL